MTTDEMDTYGAALTAQLDELAGSLEVDTDRVERAVREAAVARRTRQRAGLAAVGSVAAVLLGIAVLPSLTGPSVVPIEPVESPEPTVEASPSPDGTSDAPDDGPTGFTAEEQSLVDELTPERIREMELAELASAIGTLEAAYPRISAALNELFAEEEGGFSDEQQAVATAASERLDRIDELLASLRAATGSLLEATELTAPSVAAFDRVTLDQVRELLLRQLAERSFDGSEAELAELEARYAVVRTERNARLRENGEAAGTWSASMTSPIRNPLGAVWTGEVVLVHGDCGEVGCGLQLATFDPTDGSWTEPVDVPFPATHGGSTVWTGEEMLTLGGYEITEFDPDVPRSQPTVSGWSYRPDTGELSAIPEAPLAPRDGASVVWTGTEVVVHGGHSAQAAGATEESTAITTYADGAAWDPTTSSWRTIADAPSARTLHGAVWADDRMVVVGGQDGDEQFIEAAPGQPTTTAAAWDPTTDSWTELGDTGVGGLIAATAWTGELVLVWNGSTATWPGFTEGGDIEPAAVAIDPGTGTVTMLDAPAVRVRRDGDAPHAWASELDALLTIGGSCGEGCNSVHADGALWRTDGSSTPLTESPLFARPGAHAVWTGEQLVVVGGTARLYESHDYGQSTTGVVASWQP